MSFERPFSLLLPRRKAALDLSIASVDIGKGEAGWQVSVDLASGVLSDEGVDLNDELAERLMVEGNLSSINVSFEYFNDFSPVFRISHSNLCCSDRFITV